MAFEIIERDLSGRIGKLKTKSGEIETPALLPVINPLLQPVSPRVLMERFGFEAVITNAYIISKNLRNEAETYGIHKVLDFDGPVMTDSGAYQNLVYGKVETTVDDITRFQEKIETDIAVILDIPTGWKITKDKAVLTVEETLKRAERTVEIRKKDNDILWVGPIQGGRYLDLIAYSAEKMGALPFQIYALGSPTKVMEQYFFDVLVDMIVAAKTHLPLDKPLHLFGAGHPFMFAFAVALGCDLFDSAAYALYARKGKYMTEYGTSDFNEMDFLPCSCPVCTKYSPKEINAMLPMDRERLLAEHNLYECQSEIRRIKQSIVEGRLWELLETRARGHPALLQALKTFGKYTNLLERESPIYKRRGFFYFDSTGLPRPEIARHSRRILENYESLREREILLLLPQLSSKPFHNTTEYRRVNRIIQDLDREGMRKIETCAYAVPFGVIPLELDEVYPLSQYEATIPFDEESTRYICEEVRKYIKNSAFGSILLHSDNKWGKILVDACRKTCKDTGKELTISYRGENPWGPEALQRLTKSLEKVLKKYNN